MSHSTPLAILKAGSAAVICFGLVVAAAAVPALDLPARLLVDLAFLPLDGSQSLAAPETRFALAVGGGVMFGWGVMLWLVATRLYPREPALARSIILASVIAWFLVDSVGSVVAGAPFNALLNVGFLIVFGYPLLSKRA